MMMEQNGTGDTSLQVCRPKRNPRKGRLAQDRNDEVSRAEIRGILGIVAITATIQSFNYMWPRILSFRAQLQEPRPLPW